MELTPIKVTILLKPRDKKGRFLYPNFDAIPADVREGLRWQDFIDKYGGWLYDRKGNHSTDEPESPLGHWHGVILVPDPFADAAAAMFPETVKQLTEAELETFYNERVAATEPRYQVHEPTLNAIRAMQAAGIPLTQEDRDALDPSKDVEGVRHNPRRNWAAMKAHRGIKVKNKKRK